MALSARDRRALIILGGIVGVLLVGFVILKVIGGGGGETAAPTTGPTSPVPAPTVSASVSPSSAAPAQEVFNGRDPFSPPAALAGAGAAGATGGADTGGGATTNPSQAAPSSPPVVPTTNPTGGGNHNGGGGKNHHHNTKPGDTKKVGGKTVKLVAVRHPGGKKQAQILVDETGYVVSPGERFGTNFKLVSIEAQCTAIVYGDQKFTLCAKASNKKSPG